MEYDFDVYYYDGKGRKKKDESGKTVEVEGEIDRIIQENGILYPVEIKMSTMPKASMTSEFDVLDGIPDKKRGTGARASYLPKPRFFREDGPKTACLCGTTGRRSAYNEKTSKGRGNGKGGAMTWTCSYCGWPNTMDMYYCHHCGRATRPANCRWTSHKRMTCKPRKA